LEKKPNGGMWEEKVEKAMLRRVEVLVVGESGATKRGKKKKGSQKMMNKPFERIGDNSS